METSKALSMFCVRRQNNKMNDKKSISYEEAFGELQNILEEIKERTVSVDELSSKVKRARKLIEICEEKIRKVEMEIKEITQDQKKE